MSRFLKFIFVLFLFFPCDSFARVSAARKLVKRTLNQQPTKKDMSQLEREISSFVEEIYPGHITEFRNGSVTGIIRGMVDDSSLSDLNFRAALYSVAIKSLPLDGFSRDPYFYLVTEFTFALRNETPITISEISDIISSPYFRLPSIEGDINEYRPIVFDYVKRNFDHIHAKGDGGQILHKWWPDEDFREIVFASIQKKHLDSPDMLLKWWKEDRRRGAGRLEAIIMPYFEKTQGKITGHIENDAFWGVVSGALRDSSDFSWAISSVFDRMTGSVENFTPGMISATPSERLRNLPPEELRNLNNEQAGAFTEDQLRVFGPEQRRALLRVHTHN